MGLFDDLLKIADKGLTAVENGAVEQALTNGIDKLEAGLDKAIENAEKVAAAPEQLLQKAEEKHEQLTQTVQNVQQQASKTIDVFKNN